MRTAILIFSLFVSTAVYSAQWVEVTTADIETIQLVQAGNSHGGTEGLYLGLNSAITGEASSYCTRNTFLVITDQKLMDRAYSGLMFAMSTKRTVKFYLDGQGTCVGNGPLATMFMLKP